MLSNNHIQIKTYQHQQQQHQQNDLINNNLTATTSTSSIGVNPKQISASQVPLTMSTTGRSGEVSSSSRSTQAAPSNPVQVQNYITWINSHLKKRPGVKLVENLQTDLSNGVCLIHLIEVISGTVLTDVNLNPKTLHDSKENIEKILKFMQVNSIKMHQTTSKEIIEGNIKSIMRLVLALAAHFKPTNVQPYSAVMSSKIVASQQNSTAPVSSTMLSNSSTSTSKNSQLVINKRSQSTNNVNSASQMVNHPAGMPSNVLSSTATNQYYTSTNQIQNSTANNNTYIIGSNLNQNQTISKNSLNQTRNLDSMTHLVQAACVSLADVRRYKNENFNVKYVKRNVLNSPNSKQQSSSNYLNPITLTQNTNNYNQTYNISKTSNNLSPNPKNPNMSTMSNTTFLSPNAVQPIASSTILHSNSINRTKLLLNVNKNNTYAKSAKNSTYVLNKQEDAETTTASASITDTSYSSTSSASGNSINENKNEDEQTADNDNSNNNSNNDNKTNANGSEMACNLKPESKTLTSISASSCEQSETLGESTNKKNTIVARVEDDFSNQLSDNSELLADVQSVKGILLNLQTLLMSEDFTMDQLPAEMRELIEGNNLERRQDKEVKLNKSNSSDSGGPNSSQDSNSGLNNYDANSSNMSSSSNLNDDDCPLSSLTQEEQIAIYRSKIQQLEILCTDLRNELNQAKAESMQTNGIHCGLKHRVTEQDNTILEMKNEQLNLHLVNQQLLKEKEDLHAEINELNSRAEKFKQELLSRNDTIDKLKQENATLLREKEQTKYVRQQVKQVSETLEIVQEKEIALSEMVANTDRKLAQIDSKLAGTKEVHLLSDINKHSKNLLVQQTGPYKANKDKSIVSQDEASNLKESIIKLRQNFNPNHPSQLLINNLETGINMIIERSTSSFAVLKNNANLYSCEANNPVIGAISSESSSLTSSSANSPVLQLAQSPTSSTSSSAASSVHSSSSSLSSNPHATIKQNQNVDLKLDIINQNEKNSENNEQPVTCVNTESNVKKIISRLLSQTYVVPGANNVNTISSTSSTSQSSLFNHPKKIEIERNHPHSNHLVATKSASHHQLPPTNSHPIRPSSTLLTISSTSTLTSSNSTEFVSPNAITTISTSSSSSAVSSSSGSSSITSSSSLTSINTNQNSTKCVYYIDKNNTPFMTTIFKNINSVTLSDFKECVKLKSKDYRFHFKTVDPEFGTVREEISEDFKILPNYDNKIVVWIESI